MFLCLFLFFSMLLLYSFFRLKELFKLKNGLTISLLFVFIIENAKNLGRSDNAKWKKRGWPNITPKDKKLFVIYFLCIHVELCFIIFGLSCLTAKKHLTELQKRLDTTERTMHLVMKQMEAVTKCLAKTLAEDPSMSGDKSLAEITEGLVNLKESNV